MISTIVAAISFDFSDGSSVHKGSPKIHKPFNFLCEVSKCNKYHITNTNMKNTASQKIIVTFNSL